MEVVAGHSLGSLLCSYRHARHYLYLPSIYLAPERTLQAPRALSQRCIPILRPLPIYVLRFDLSAGHAISLAERADLFQVRYTRLHPLPFRSPHLPLVFSPDPSSATVFREPIRSPHFSRNYT